jgi:ribosome biogenesis GTPase
MTGLVVSLDRGFPLVATAAGEFRAQHGIELVKKVALRAAVGDVVDLEWPAGQDIPLIRAIHPRRHTLVRRSLVESRHEGAGKHDEQVLAANIDIVFVVSALSNRPLDTAYLERQLVMAHESGAEVAIVLTKADLGKHRDEDVARARELAFTGPVITTSAATGEGLSQIAELLEGGRVGVLLGRSGVGKSTLVNEMLGAPLLETATVRAKDRAGRHTTVARRMVFLGGEVTKGTVAERRGSRQGTVTKGTVPFCQLSPLAHSSENASKKVDKTEPSPLSPQAAPSPRQPSPLSPPGALIDTPGLRSIGLYDAHVGLAAAFPDVTALAAQCRYRDCTHTGEPSCAVTAAVADGGLSPARLASYVTLAAEVNA